MQSPEAIDSLIRSHDLAEHRASILRSSKPSLRMLLTEPSGDDQETRIGGLPLLPDEFDWPLGKDGEPLGFLAQINLGNLPTNPLGLPDSGLLSFFFDIERQPWGCYEDAGSWRIVYSQFNSRFRVRSAPSGSKQPILP